jgi:hypothetical protein
MTSSGDVLGPQCNEKKHFPDDRRRGHRFEKNESQPAAIASVPSPDPLAPSWAFSAAKATIATA